MRLTELLDRFGSVQQQHDGWLAHCPAHSDAQASLRIAVTPDGTGLLKCRAGCDTARVLAAVGLSFSDLRGITEVTGVAISSERTAPLDIATIAALRADLDRYAAGVSIAVREYALERFAIDNYDFERLGLGKAADLPGGTRLVVPFCNPDGVALGFQARAIDPEAKVRWYGPRNPEQGSWSRLGFFSGDSGWDEVIITEGPGDALTACAVGYDAIAVRGAGLAGRELAEQIVAWVPNRPIVLAGDGDNAGRSFSTTLADALADMGVTVKVLALPDGMDLTDWLASDFAGFPNALIHAVTTTPATTSTALALMQRDENLFPLTDLGNARYVAALAAQHGTALRYIEEIGFLVLSNGIWTEDRLERSRALVHESADLVGDIADALMESAGNDQQLQAEARRWKAWAKYCASKRGIDAVLSEIKALPMVATRIEDLDRHHHLLAVRNGVLDLREGVLLEHDPLLLLTKRIDLDYDPTADCPRWVQYLHEVMRGDAVMVDYLQRLVGYGITGETTEQCFSVLWGSGANGKTVFTSTLSEVFEAISVTTPFSTFEQKASGGIPNDLAALRGARLVFAAEGEADKPMAEALLKSLTGRDLVTARFLRKEFFTFRPTFQLMLATNNKPSFKGQDEGLWRRVKLIEWSRYFAPNERDHRLPDVLLGEAQGILAWAVRGSVTWFARGLDDPSPIQHATTEYRSTSDPLSGFLPGVFIADVHAKRVLGKDVFDAYLHWAEAENLKPSEIVTRRKFFSWLEERGIAKRASKGGVAFDGIRRARPSDFPDLEDEVDVERLPPETPLVSGVSVAEGLA